MFYKPAYCCHCGEKIERTEWLPWTSGRFCDACQKEFSFHEWMPKIFVLIFGLFGLFGIGSLLRATETTRVVSLKQNGYIESEDSLKIGTSENAAQNTYGRNVQQNAPPVESNKAAGTNKNFFENSKRETAAVETDKVYYCGATTKKGTPCSRKVKGGGRCWQHKGQEAMLAQEKLLITQ